jgi:uncharacterized membrane-anchored protein
MPRDRGAPKVHPTSWRVLAGGLLLIALYAVLSALTTIGDPGDIGGGLILLLGYLVTGVGVLLVGHDLWESRSQRR